MRGLIFERGVCVVLTPGPAVPGGELVGERPELGAIEGAELHQAVPTLVKDILLGQRCRESELCIARRAR